MGKKKKKPKAAGASAGADDDEAGVEASEVTVEVPAHADDGLQPDVATQVEVMLARESLPTVGRGRRTRGAGYRTKSRARTVVGRAARTHTLSRGRLCVCV